MVLFGELVIPSSRILWDDEDEIEQYQADSTIEWQGDCSIPDAISNLLIIESTKLSEIAQTCLENTKPICSLAEEHIKIFKTIEDNYLVLCENAENVMSGEVTEKLIPWLETANRVIAVTAIGAATFQKKSNEELPASFIKALWTGDCGAIHGPKLEAPNLVPGIGAGVLSYCQHIGKSAALYVCFLEPRPLDSTTAGPVLQLLQKLNIPSSKPFVFKPVFKADSNLYM